MNNNDKHELYIIRHLPALHWLAGMANRILAKMGVDRPSVPRIDAAALGSAATDAAGGSAAKQPLGTEPYVSPAGVEMRPAGTGVLLAQPPFLLDGALNRKSSPRACMAECALLFECEVGTFIRLGAGDGQCWLSSKAYHKQALPCGTLGCQSFVRQHWG